MGRDTSGTSSTMFIPEFRQSRRYVRVHRPADSLSVTHVKQNSTGSLMSAGPLFEFSKLKQAVRFIVSQSLQLNIADVFK